MHKVLSLILSIPGEALGRDSPEKPTCHFNISCGFGNAVFNHTGVSVVDCDVVEHGHNLHGHILRVQLKAGIGGL